MLLTQVVQSALRQWSRGNLDSEALAHLHCYRNILAEEGVSSAQAAAIRLLSETLAQLTEQNRERADVVSLRYQQGYSVAAVSRKLDISESHVHRKQREAIEHFRDLIAEKEAGLLRQRRSYLTRRLPLPAGNRLFGIDEMVNRLYRQLLDPNSPALISIEGIGGIGKTAVADALIRRAIDEDAFEDFGWVSVQENAWHPDANVRFNSQSPLSALELMEALIVQLAGEETLPVPFSMEAARRVLEHHFQSKPHLIVVDNLETMADLTHLLPLLQDLAGRTRFVLTSRYKLHAQAALFPVRVPALSAPDAIALVRYWAGQSNLPEVATAADSELGPIYEAVGGNPLALRLVVGQCQYYNLRRVLSALCAERGRAIEQIYAHIYRRAWTELNQVEQAALSAMRLLPPEGSDLDYLIVLTDMEENILFDALERLIASSLVEHRHDGLGGSRYFIHALTRTFLLESALRWADGEPV